MAETHYYDDRITGVESALDFLPPLDLGNSGTLRRKTEEQ
jgi:hypothetical protein